MKNKLSKNLKEIRKKENLSQEDLAELLGVSRQSISKWESGSSYPEMDKIISIANMYNLSIDDLLNGDAYKTKEENDYKKKTIKYFNKGLNYLEDTINAFIKLSFGTKIKAMFELGINYIDVNYIINDNTIYTRYISC